MEQTILVPLIIGLVGVVRLSGVVANRYLPFVAVVLGVAMNYLAGVNGGDVVIGGIVAGLMAAGLWDNLKSGVVLGSAGVKKIVAVFK